MKEAFSFTLEVADGSPGRIKNWAKAGSKQPDIEQAHRLYGDLAMLSTCSRLNVLKGAFERISGKPV